MVSAMKAMVIRSFGEPDVFEERDVPTPAPGPREVRVRVHATSVNPVDYKIRRGGEWAGVKPPAVIGYDVAGVVDAVGPAVTGLRVGDEVYHTPEIFGGSSGGYAEFHVAHESIVARKPARASFEEAAAIPLAGSTAWTVLHERLRLGLGETVLIHGGAGGVGHFAVQIAKASGARVLATASARNQEFLRGLGVDVPIDYGSQDFVEVALRETGGVGVDAVFDTVGGDLIPRSLPCIRPFGRAAGIVDWKGDYGLASLKNITLHPAFLTRRREPLDALRVLVDRGLLRPHVDAVHPLREVAAAHRRIETGHGRGKGALRGAT